MVLKIGKLKVEKATEHIVISKNQRKRIDKRKKHPSETYMQVIELMLWELEQ